MKSNMKYPRGAEWRQWDFHVHTPASFQWTGKRFVAMNPQEIAASVDSMIEAMNDAAPEVFVLMDYWTFDGWFALKQRLSEAEAPRLKKVVFPGIELRLVSPTPYRLNAHVVFSDKVSDQDLQNFRSKLQVALVEQPLSDECLVRLARAAQSDILSKHGFKKQDVLIDTEVALRAGCTMANITPESYRAAITAVPGGNAVGFMPWDTNDGLAEADWVTHYAFVTGLMKSSPIFETRRRELWEAFVGVRSQGNHKWFDNFQGALDFTPRLAVSGSDAHSYADYGRFPSGKVTWIKADPTFLGLKQAIKEPARRSFIGARPEKLKEVDENKTYFIDKVSVNKVVGSSLNELWLDGAEIDLNHDLVAIIGNKGSGKSALADVIALVGNSRSKHFSFLTAKRFRAPPTVFARQFVGKLDWRDGTESPRNLAVDPPVEAVEMVRYIPQMYFEELCNEHASGKSDVFENELRSVIFAHTKRDIRQQALDFNQLIEHQESGHRVQLGESRKNLNRLNQEISAIESQLHPDKRRGLVELHAQKQKQIDELDKVAPQDVAKPADKLSREQTEAAKHLDEIAEQLRALEESSRWLVERNTMAAAKAAAARSVHTRVQLFQGQFKQLEEDTREHLKVLGVELRTIVSLEVHAELLDRASVAAGEDQKAVARDLENLEQRKAAEIAKQSDLKNQLNGPQQLYQTYLNDLAAWQKKRAELMGSPEDPDTLLGLRARIAQLDSLPEELERKRRIRRQLSADIHDVLDSQRLTRASLFEPVQDVIAANQLIQEDYRLQFRADLGGSPDVLAARLFELVKRTAGEFRGEEESLGVIKKVLAQYDLNKKEDTLALLEELDKKLRAMIPKGKGPALEPILKNGRAAVEVYDLLFGLSFLEPRYTLLFQDTRIEQLSPGQRGALLLIFYLLVDTGRHPIILDQPEENLDNETIVSLLVPVLDQAKKNRQIIMVTHNPNLAVVCDAEQIIYSMFDRKAGSKISYEAGSIEDPSTNKHVIDILEGTKPAFNNRRDKYHPSRL